MDSLTKKQRSALMGRIRSRDTGVERVVCLLVKRAGYRIRRNDRRLPASPDIVIPRLSAVVLVHGCFWHRHLCRKGRSMPATRRAFWEEKLRRNTERDRRQLQDLRRDGWRALVVWECQMTPEKLPKLRCRIAEFLRASSLLQRRASSMDRRIVGRAGKGRTVSR